MVEAWVMGRSTSHSSEGGSRLARQFLAWLALPAEGAWLDVGCGTGALSASILANAAPRLVIGCDRSAGYVEYAGEHIQDPRGRFVVAELAGLPLIAEGFDAVVAGLVLNFLPDALDALGLMSARAKEGGTVAVYVWDYAGQMQMLRRFWDAAVALNPAARDLFTQAGLDRVTAQAIETPTVFQSFEHYWRPFLGGQGPAPGYARALAPADLSVLREMLRASLPTTASGEIRLIARAWAARGVVA
jgi:SAM-dependent methyltransferase